MEDIKAANDLLQDSKSGDNTKTISGNKVGLQWIKNALTFDNDVHKKNFIQTICVYFNFILLGWTYGQLGTAFPDLQLILNTNVQQTSLIFTMNSVGYMVGSLVIGFVYDRVQHLKLLGILSIVNGITSCVLPWCNVFPLFLFVRLVDGILCGGRDGGGNAKVASCWGTGGRKYMQALHFAYSLGGIVSPIVTSFFLAPRIYSPAVNVTNNSFSGLFDTNISFLNNNSPDANVSKLSYGREYKNLSNIHNDTGIVSFDSIINVTDSSSVHVRSDNVTYGDTRVHAAFVVTGILTSFSGVIYICLSRKGYDNIPPYTKKSGHFSERVESTKAYRARFTSGQRIMFIIVLGFAVVIYSTVECKYQSFIMPFVMMHLDWTKSNGAFLISLLWAFYGFGRLSGIFISGLISPRNLLLLFLSMLILASCGTWIVAHWYVHSLVWIVIPFAGFAISIIFPTFIVWTQENALKINGKMGGFFLFVGALGFLIDPLYVGILMESQTPMYFVYLNVIQSSVALGLVLLMFRWIGSLKKKNNII